jgi:hypothetical protein
LAGESRGGVKDLATRTKEELDAFRAKAIKDFEESSWANPTGTLQCLAMFWPCPVCHAAVFEDDVGSRTMTHSSKCTWERK